MLDNALRPFLTMDKNLHKGYDAEITIRWGGLAGQSDAIKLGFARALIVNDEGMRPTLKWAGTLKRDGRVKERKKPGLKKARKAPTWSKR
jgi:small subunit ribosomal protein S9